MKMDKGISCACWVHNTKNKSPASATNGPNKEAYLPLPIINILR